MQEKWQPFSHTPPESFSGFLKFYGRMIFDLQVYTIFFSIKKHVKQFSGNVLDIGCGQSPYRFLLDKKKTNYVGLDIENADRFNYNNNEVTHFSGGEIPFENEKFNAFICTEVLEHVSDYQKLIDEIYRVSKKDAKGVITIPWSARYHYIPYDYFRFTPSSIKSLFSKFDQVEIITRGSDITSIVSKIIVLFFRNIFSPNWYSWIFIPLWLCFIPLLFVLIAVAFLSLWFKAGDENDPLGYTVIVKK